MLKEIFDMVLSNQSVIDKINIPQTYDQIGDLVSSVAPTIYNAGSPIRIGDDCAAIPDGAGGFLLFAAEGIVSSFLDSSPWFAGYSAVMVNISDVCAMGGVPLAVTDVLWIKDSADGLQIWEGMQAASKAYGVPIVGGHTCYRSKGRNLAVSILGKAEKLLTSFDAKPGQNLLIAMDLKGSYFEDYPFFNASTSAQPDHLQNIITLMAVLANKGWSRVAKDISMGGIIGTLAMLMHSSGVGAEIELMSIPKPSDIQWEKWLTSFPSFGFLFTCDDEHLANIRHHFHQAQIHCEAIGVITESGPLTVSCNNEKIEINLNRNIYA